MTDPHPDRLDDQLEARLRGAFTPPPAESFTAMARAVSGGRVVRRRWIAAAAAAVLLIVVHLATRPPLTGPEGHDGSQLGALWAAAYAEAVNSETLESCCDPGSDLASLCRQSFAQEIRFENRDVATLCGCYRGGATGGTVAVLLRRDRQVVGVFVLPTKMDPGARLPEGSALALTRRRLGALALYAIAPEPADDVLAGFTSPRP